MGQAGGLRYKSFGLQVCIYFNTLRFRCQNNHLRV